MRFEFGFGSADDQPKDFRFGIIENLAEELRTNENTAVLWHCKCLLADTNTPNALDDEIELFCPDMFVERVRALRWESPKASAKNLASTPLQKIGVWNLHHV